MSTLNANIVESTAVTSEFKDVITANGDKQWVDSYGIIKTNRDTISEDVVIPSGSNGLSSGPVTIASGYTVTVNGEWAIV